MTRLLLAFALVAAATPVTAAERRYSVTDFDRIEVEGPFIVRLTTGRSSSAVANGSQASLDRATVDVTGTTLRIRRNRANWTGNAGAQTTPLTIDVVTRNLRSARLVGPASLEIQNVEGLRVNLTVEGSGRLRASNVAADNLSIGLAGSGRLELSGTAETLTADIQGTGDVDAAQLRAENATITTTTSGTIALEVSLAANVTALGLGTVEIVGRPACTVRGPNSDLVRCGEGPSLDQR